MPVALLIHWDEDCDVGRGNWSWDARTVLTSRKAFLSPWRGSDNKGRDVVRENKGRRNVSDEPF